MSRFTDKLVVSLEKDGEHWVLEADFEYYTDLLGERVYINVPQGFETDFASIPKIFLPLIAYKDKFNKAAVVHDWLYRSKVYDRKTADRIFLEAMLVLNINKFKAYLFYYTVRLFGWIFWNRSKK